MRSSGDLIFIVLIIALLAALIVAIAAIAVPLAIVSGAIAIPLIYYSRSKKRWVKRLIAVCVSAAVLISFIAFAVFSIWADIRPPDVPPLGNQVMGINLDPNTWDINPVGAWTYDMSTRKFQNYENPPSILSDWDFERGVMLGVSDGVVVETDTETGEVRELGPARYLNSDLVPFTLQYQPGGQNYSALTEQGNLVLWERETGTFRLLAEFPNWSGVSFAHSWLDDGRTLCIPDDTGIALLNTDTLEQTHWVSLPISYSGPGGHYEAKKPFAVAGDQSMIIYYEDSREVKVATIGPDGTILETILLVDSGHMYGDCSFAFSPDSQSVLFAYRDIKRTWFNPNYFEVRLYHDGAVYKLFESRRITSPSIQIFW